MLISDALTISIRCLDVLCVEDDMVGHIALRANRFTLKRSVHFGVGILIHTV